MLDQAEVEERDPAVSVEDVVARVRVAVECPEPVQTAEDEAEDRLARHVALLLRPLENLGERVAADEFGDENARGRQFVDHLGHMDKRVPAVEVGEHLLVLRLARVVEFLAQSFLYLGDHFLGVQALEPEREKSAQQVCRAQVCINGLGNAGVLHLHGDSTLACVRTDDRTVHLSDRRGRYRLVVELDEQLGHRPAEFAFDLCVHQFGAHRGCIRLQLGECEAQRLGEPVVEITRHLAEFHQCALHVAQFVGDLLGGLQFACAREFLASRRTREHLAGRGSGMGETDARTETGKPAVAPPTRPACNGVSHDGRGSSTGRSWARP